MDKRKAGMLVRHIGNVFALCDGRKKANLRDDLGEDRYRRLGIKERFVGEAPYRVCRECVRRLHVRWYPRDKQNKILRAKQRKRS